jgi:hypothetical protein
LLRHVGLSRVKGGDPDHGPGLSWPGTSWSVRCDFALKEIADQGDHLIGLEDTNDRALRSSQTWTDGATRFLKGYVAEGSDAATATERVFANAFSGAEDALVGFIATGKLEFRGLADSILVGLARTTVRQTITAPIAGALQNAFAGGGLFGLFHEGGIAGERPPGVRYADASVFDHAPRYHGGGFAGSGLLPDEVPIIARRGELVVPPERVVREEKSAREQRLIANRRTRWRQGAPRGRRGGRFACQAFVDLALGEADDDGGTEIGNDAPDAEPFVVDQGTGGAHAPSPPKPARGDRRAWTDPASPAAEGDRMPARNVPGSRRGAR